MSANWRLQAISSAAKNRKRSTFVLRAGENLVGKRAESHIKIYSVLCSRAHCSLHLIDDEITLEDYVSSNSLFIFLQLSKQTDEFWLFSHRMVPTLITRTKSNTIKKMMEKLRYRAVT